MFRHYKNYLKLLLLCFISSGLSSCVDGEEEDFPIYQIDAENNQFCRMVKDDLVCISAEEANLTGVVGIHQTNLVEMLRHLNKCSQ